MPNGRRARSTGEAQTASFCENTENWLTQIKLIGSYTLPYEVQLAATLQNQPGPERVALVNYSAGAIADILGQPPTDGAQTVNVIPPGTAFGDRFTQFDIRFTKIFSFGGSARFRAMFDIFNLFNANSVAFEEPAYGNFLWNPQVILPGRLGKFAFQIDF